MTWVESVAGVADVHSVYEGVRWSLQCVCLLCCAVGYLREMMEECCLAEHCHASVSTLGT